MTTVTVTLLISLSVVLTAVNGFDIDPCDGTQKTQVDETSDAVFTCTGIPASAVRWGMIHASSTNELFGTCIRPSQCIVHADNVTITMPDSTTSVLTITGRHRRLAGTLQCAGLNEGQFVAATTCDVAVVYTSYTLNCSTTVVTTTDPWTVRASCDVDKVFASDGQYSCQWSQQSSSGTNVTVSGHRSTSPFTDSGEEYQRMTCSFSGHPMPTADGTYDYSLTIEPRMKLSDTHSTFQMNIQSPKRPPVLHNCPSDVLEGDDVFCTCQASPSNPPALVKWSSSSAEDVRTTSLLQLTNVSKSLDGHSFTCSQYWAGFSAEYRMVTSFIISVASSGQTTEKGTTTYIPSNNDDELKAIAASVGAVALVIIIALIIVIVLLVKRRNVCCPCEPLYAKPAPRRGQEVEHTYAEMVTTQPPDHNAHDTQPESITGVQQLYVNTASAEQPYEVAESRPQQHSSDGHYENTGKTKQPASTESEYENTSKIK